MQAVDGDTERYDAELRPELMRGAIAAIQDGGSRSTSGRSRASTSAQTARCSSSRPALAAARALCASCSVVAPMTPRSTIGSSKLPPWTASSGSAIGRSIWWNPLKQYVDGKIERSEGARQIAENYLRFVKVYERAEGEAPVA